MLTRPAQCMIGFGVFLGACGVAGWAAAGFADKAKTAIVSGAVSGALMIAAGALAAHGRPGWRLGGVMLGVLFSSVFTAAFAWRASIAWTAYAGGEPKLYVAALLSVMTLASVGVLAALVSMLPWRTGLRRGATSSPPRRTGRRSLTWRSPAAASEAVPDAGKELAR